jgi:hypothetical protein
LAIDSAVALLEARPVRGFRSELVPVFLLDFDLLRLVFGGLVLHLFLAFDPFWAGGPNDKVNWPLFDAFDLFMV